MKKGLLLLCSILTIFGTQSCEDDDICTGEGTPKMTVVFRDILNDQNQQDTLTIYSSDNQYFENAELVYDKVFTDSLKLDLGGVDTERTYFKIQRRSNEISDTLIIDYQPNSGYISKACGFRITYSNLSYSSTQNHIQYLIPAESNEIKDESITNLYIVLGN